MISYSPVFFVCETFFSDVDLVLNSCTLLNNKLLSFNAAYAICIFYILLHLVAVPVI